MKKLLVTTALICSVGFSVTAEEEVSNPSQENVLGSNQVITGGSYGGDHEDYSAATEVVGGDKVTSTTTVTNKTQTYRQNGYVSNPGLTTSGQDTCFGSQSSGVSGPGFGISGGKTVVDENCVMMKQVKLLASLGLKDAAVLLMMNSDEDIAAAVWGANPDLADHLTSIKEQ